MTLSSVSSTAVVFVGSGTRGPFPFSVAGTPIRLTSSSHLKVTRYASATTDTGVLLVEGSDYTVSGLPDAPVIMLTMSQNVLVPSERLVAERVQPFAQDLDITVGGSFPADSVEARLDKIVEYAQDLRTLVNRAVSRHPLNEGSDVVLPPAESGKVLGWDGTTLVNVPIVGSGGGGGGGGYVSVHRETAVNGQTVIPLPWTYTIGSNALEVYLNGLRLDGPTAYTEASTSSIVLTSPLTAGDQVLVAQTSVGVPVLVSLDGSVDACAFGADPAASAATNRNAIQAAIDYQAARGGGKVTFSKYGVYNIAKRAGTGAANDRALNLRKGVTLSGAGATVTNDTFAPFLRLVILQAAEDMASLISQESMQESTVTISNASPAVITWTGHGRAVDDRVQFSTTGALPAGLLPNVWYFVRTVLGANTFTVSLTSGGAAINTSSAGSGVHTAFTASLLHTCGIEGLTVTNGPWNVTHLVRLSPVNSTFEKNYLQRGAGTAAIGLKIETNPIAAWVNFFRENRIGGFQDCGLDVEGTDSFFTDNYISGNATGAKFTCNGAFSFKGNTVEVSSVCGVLIRGGSFDATFTAKLDSNYYHLNTLALRIEPGATFATIDTGITIEDNFNANTNDIQIASGVRGGQIAGCQFFQTNAAGRHVSWGGTNNGNWLLGPNYYSLPVNSRFTNLPPTAVVGPSTGFGGYTGQRVYGSETVLGQANVAARIGVTGGTTAIDAALLTGVEGGINPFFAARDGETTAAGQFNFYHNATLVGHFSASEWRFLQQIRNANHILPTGDNLLDLGSGSLRMRTIFAGTGTINTSDQREKTPLRELSPAELRAARRIRLGAFQWLDAVSRKGPDGARIHIGVIAQQVAEAFAAEGLDAARYGLFCADPVFEEIERREIAQAEIDGEVVNQERTWYERVPVLDENGEQLIRYGVRMDQLLAFKLAASEAAAPQPVPQPAPTPTLIASIAAPGETLQEALARLAPLAAEVGSKRLAIEMGAHGQLTAEDVQIETQYKMLFDWLRG